MRLARLTLNGFKSFADRAEFTFDEAVIGIVGPNGCGKSNVVDAVKWVLGERSSKSLRGKEMIDVIFAGSAGRKPAGMAAVTLTFDNPVIDAAAEMVELALDSEESGVRGQESEVSGQKSEVSDQEAEPAADSSSLRLSVSPSLPDHPGAPIASPKRRRRALPLDADTVEVERRLYRDGTSQYLINGRRARLKDIRDLFLDTGIGADAYSIIEQGKVDAMLLASPQERRTIFEEAAGIARYKARRIESQRKLERSQANLAVTREQLASTERRLRIVKGQAAKARKFVELDRSLRAARMALAFDQYDDLVARLEGLTSQIARLGEEREAAAAALAAMEQERQDAEQSRHDLLAAQKEVQERALSARHAEQTANQRRSMTERALAEARRQLDSDGGRLAALNTRRDELDAALTEHDDRATALAERLTELDRLLREASDARAAAAAALVEQRAALAERRAAAASIERERATLLTAGAAESRRIEHVREQANTLLTKAEATERELAGVAAQRAVLESESAARRERTGALESALAERDGQDLRLSEDRRALADRLADLDARRLRADGRRQTLQEMIAGRVGLAEAVRFVLDEKSAGRGFAGVAAPLADLIDAEAPDAPFVEAALGSLLQALVVDSLAAIPSAEDRSRLPGRVTFLPLAAIAASPFAANADANVGATSDSLTDGAGPATDPQGHPHHEGLSARRASDRCQGWPASDTPGKPPNLMNTAPEGRTSEPPYNEQPDSAFNIPDSTTHIQSTGRAIPLWSLVHPRPNGHPSDQIQSLLTRLLGRTWLVESLDAAMMLAAGPLAGCRFVTRDGGVLEPDGRILAGPLAEGAGDSTGFLQRRGEVRQLDSEIATLDSALAAERAHLAELDSEAAAVNAARADLRQRLAAEQRALAADSARLEHLGHAAARLERDARHLRAESAQLEGRIAGMEEDLRSLHARAESLRRLHEEQSAAAAEAERDIESAQQRADQAAERVTAARVESGRVGEQVQAARREQQRLTAARDACGRERLEVESHLAHARSRVEQHAAAIEHAAQEATEASAQAQTLEQHAAEAGIRVEGAAALATSLAERVQSARTLSQRIERDWHGLEVARREVEVKREGLEERASDELSLDLAFEHADYRAMMADGTVARIDARAVESEAAELKSQIAALGSVNLDALEEEAGLEQRNEQLIAQVKDIDDACARLSALIDELNTASRERFGAAFKTIADHFSGEAGMFRKLFGGGKAEVRLMPLVKEINGEKVQTDEIDVLESGVEVIAKPPGKEPRAISQLSGGEKTLTAVALLLSIFRSKPSCFCILDEVDAALDEANVGRYNAVVREFTTESHFIVITHNKRTMQSADRLYGVTMQEKGVSKRVSVKIEQVGKGGEIARSAAEADEPTSAETAVVSVQPRLPLPEPEIVVLAGANGHSNGHGANENGRANGEGHAPDASPIVVPTKKASAALRRALAATRAEGVPASPHPDS